MNEERTRALPDKRSFEERVFARFDAMEARFEAMEARFEARFSSIDARLDRVDARLDRVEARLDGLDIRVQALEARALDTKPIWERALAEILLVKQGVEDLNRKIDVLNQDVLQVRADQRRVEMRMDALESRLQ
jgi:chromosome segregation ATPase